MAKYEILGIIQGLLAVGLLIFGGWQIAINRRLKKLQDYAAIIAVPDGKDKIKLLNTGKVNLFLWGFDMPGNTQRLQKPRLIAAGTGDTAYYWIDTPQSAVLQNMVQDTHYCEFQFTLYLKDEFNKEWISEHGGRADKVQSQKDGVKTDGFRITVWSYKIYKKKWSIQPQKEIAQRPPNTITQDKTDV